MRTVEVATVGQLKEVLIGVPNDTPLATQHDRPGIGFTLHHVDVWLDGHIGFKGVIFQHGKQVENPVAAT